MKILTAILVLFVCLGCNTRQLVKTGSGDGMAHGFVVSDSLITSSGTLTLAPNDLVSDSTQYDTTKDCQCGSGSVTSVKMDSTTAITINSDSPYDTTKVIMLVCDTTKIEGQANSLEMTDGRHLVIGNRKHYSPITFWQYGYEVYTTEWVEARKITTDDGGIGILPAHNERILISRLDANKKPLSKNIIVWQSILIK